MAAALTRLGYAPALEVAVLDGLHRVDIMLEPSPAAAGRPAITRRTAVEVDGPSHFATRYDAEGKRWPVPTGATRLRNLLLRGAAGLVVVCVTFVEWDQRGHNGAESETWLAQKLAVAQRV